MKLKIWGIIILVIIIIIAAFAFFTYKTNSTSYITLIEKSENEEGDFYITVVNPHLPEYYIEEFDIFIKDKSTWNLLKEDIMYIATYEKRFENSPFKLVEINYINSMRTNSPENIQ
ncbi:hypothetical protein [Alkalihalobacillus trypoxylicola]|uniref:DUF3221 domain-containing protein n=1 Tax=Alkalihalobacillus trypoxylicola TaxID=519424 RepID=A0A161PG74_9BACI|nr:hypothetical protein [Alkalihalobacillus trypoxylicola]KYG31764.1 hypothetical protein AZF04_02990 [Alkalihalobacillus trypoxylicola]